MWVCEFVDVRVFEKRERERERETKRGLCEVDDK